MPPKAMHLTDEEVKKLDEVLVIDPGRRTIATAWLPSSGAFFLDRNAYYKLSSMNKAKRYHKKKRTHRYSSNWTTPATTQGKQAGSYNSKATRVLQHFVSN